jgi:hypothetical protein
MNNQETKVKLRTSVVAVLLALGATSSNAGNFVDLRTDLDPLSVANGGLVNGANNTSADKLYIETTGATYLTGYDDLRVPADGGTDKVVAETINYRAFTGSTTTGTGTLTLLDWQVTDDVPLLPGQPQSTIYDFVYRDSADNKLVFATRYLNEVDNDQEVNFLYRYGFAGYETAAAWTFATDGDLRLYQAGRTESTSTDPEVPFDDDAVRQKGDFSVTEGNPWSGFFFVKTNAQSYIPGSEAIGFFQAGEEGQDQVGGAISGFIPTPVPEPETYAMFVLGLGALGLYARRRRQ